MPDLPEGIDPSGLTDQEALDFLRQKIGMPTRRWSDLLRNQHDQAFAVAGATKSELLADLKTAVEVAIEDGETLSDFRERFDDAVAEHGWDFRGGRGWRSRIIYETNMRTAHASGRRAQMKRIQDARPYWRYLHGNPQEPRELHLSWDGMVLPAESDWWDAHYPPGGWGCTCYVVSLSEADLERKSLSVDDPPDNGTYEWTNPQTGEVEEIPKGLDPGWNYSPGESWARSQSPSASGSYPTQIPEGQSTDGDTRDLPAPRTGRTVQGSAPEGREAAEDAPQLMPPDMAADAYRAQFRQEFGAGPGEAAIVEDPAGEPLVVHDAMLEGMDQDLRSYTQLIARTIADPDEVWAALDRQAGGDGYRLARRYLSRWEVGGEEPVWVMVEQAGDAWHPVATIDADAIDEVRRRRSGIRLFRRGSQ